MITVNPRLKFSQRWLVFLMLWKFVFDDIVENHCEEFAQAQPGGGEKLGNCIRPKIVQLQVNHSPRKYQLVAALNSHIPIF